MKAKIIVDELYEFRDHYFETHGLEKAGEKAEDVRKKLTEVLEQLDAEISQEHSKTEESIFLLERGRAINILPDYDQRAENYLSKAVKKSPKCWEAWNELGICYWKKGELKYAKDCFEGALKQERNKVSLRSLSMILRQIGDTPEERMANVHKGLETAKAALELDLKDGISWYIFGNANLSLFFLANQNTKILKTCMDAYSKALEDSISKSHPDLHLNRATALRYEGAYQEALNSYENALLYDPLWTNPEENARELVQYLEKVEMMVNQKGCLKPRQLKTFIKGIKPHHLGPFGKANNEGKSEVKILTKLLEGENPGIVILGKVICLIPNAFPFTFCLLDESESCVAVSVHNQAEGKGVIIGDSVAIPNPILQKIKISYKSKNLTYLNICVSSPLKMIVNGRSTSKDQFAPPVLSVTCKSD